MMTAEAVIDRKNQAALLEKRKQNAKALEVMARNQIQNQSYTTTVITGFVDSFWDEVVVKAAAAAAANVLENRRIEENFQKALIAAAAETVRLKEEHKSEVGARHQREDEHRAAMMHWEDSRDAALKAHERRRLIHREAFDANVASMLRAWETRKREVEAANELRDQEAKAAYQMLLEDIVEANKAHLVAFQKLLEQRSEVEAENAKRLEEAKAAHEVKRKALAVANQQRLQEIQENHVQLCALLTAEHEEAQQQALLEHQMMRDFLLAKDEEALTEARKKFQEVVQEAAALYEEECEEARAAHTAALEEVRQFNDEIWPKVRIAAIAEVELGRVQAFAEHIKYCANKFELGVNLLPDTPNFERVVEMSALTDALRKAYVDIPREGDYPWPGYERKLELGTGWMATPPPAPPAEVVDPTEFIQRLAKGKRKGKRKKRTKKRTKKKREKKKTTRKKKKKKRKGIPDRRRGKEKGRKRRKKGKTLSCQRRQQR